MRLALDILQDSTRVAFVPEPAPPILVGVPAPEMWNISDLTPGVRCARCASPDMTTRHWLTRGKDRICLACKEAYGVERGWLQYSTEECLRVVGDRLSGLSPEELSVLKTFGDSLTIVKWEDPLVPSNGDGGETRGQVTPLAESLILRMSQIPY